MLNDLFSGLKQILPAGLADEIQNNIEALVKSNFEKMDLVTREQLEVEQRKLTIAQGKIAELEQALVELSDSIKAQNTNKLSDKNSD